MKLIKLKHLIPLFLLLVLMKPNANAQLNGVDIDFMSPKTYEIGGLTITGAESYDKNALLLIAGLKVGDEIMVPGEEVSTAIKNLWDEDLFSDVSINIERIVSSTIFLNISVKERGRISKFNFSGVKKSDQDKIREKINLYDGKIITENLLINTKRIIRSFYIEKGFNNVQVDVAETVDSSKFNSKILTFVIDKKEKVKIKEINITGNTSIKEGKLKRSMKDTRERSILNIFKTAKFNQTAFKRDKQNLLNAYQEEGFRDARIVSDSVYKLDDKFLGIDIHIDEGNKYYFRNITWVGNTKYRSGQLDTILGIKSGDVYNKALLDERLFMSANSTDITSLYMDRGYLFFNLNPVEVRVEGDSIDLEMRIQEGKQARIRRIIINGNTKTNEHVILREIRTKPGDLFSRNDIIRTQRELANLQYFDPEQFQVNPIPDPVAGTVDIEYTLAEKSSDQIELSGGYGAGRLIGTLGLTFNNFSIKNFFKKESWQPLPSGDGQRLSIRGQTNGRFFQSYNFSFTEPWLGGKKPIAFSVSAFHSLFSNGLQKEDPARRSVAITGAAVSLGRRLKWPDDFFSSRHELSYQYYDVNNYGSIFAFADGIANLLTYQYTISRNSISDPIYPRSGSNFLVSGKFTPPYSLFDNLSDDDYAGLSDQDLFYWTEMYKLKFKAEWYQPLTKDKKLVLSPRIGLAFMGAYNQAKGVSPFERFYLGGSGLTGFQMDGREIIALRGYDDLAVSPGVGAPLIAKYTMELRYPLSLNPSATVYGLAFAEAGNTWTSFKEFDPFQVKRSLGVGVRIFLPMFGLLGVDYGWGFDRLEPYQQGAAANNETIQTQGYRGQFHFTIGMNLGEL